MILVWSNLFGLPKKDITHSSRFPTACLNNNITITFNKSRLQQAFAVVFPWTGMRRATQLPSKAFGNQKFVFMTKESPATDMLGRGDGGRYRHFDNFFDMSSTYRADSEIPLPYFKWYFENDTSGINSESEYVRVTKGKTKMAAWCVSNHHLVASKRDNVANALKKHGVDIDIYGSNHLSCPRSKEKQCIDMISNKYKFYLSFENSNCREYITEKFFKIFNLKLVPVVLGGGDYASVIPESGFIDVASYKSIKDLAEYLIKLDKNDTMYLEHLKWKFNKTVVTESPTMSMFCTLNDLLSDNPSAGSRQKYSDLKAWWYTGQCVTGPQQFDRTFLNEFYKYE